MCAGDGNAGVGGFECVDGVGSGCVEGDYFSANSQIIADCSLAGGSDAVEINSFTSLALECMHQKLLLKLSAHWQYPIDPEVLQEWRP